MLVVLSAVAWAWVGSWLGQAAWRVPRRLSLRGVSRCPGCGARVAPALNVPVWSFLRLRGRAACCGARLARRYLLLEVCFGAAGVAVCVWLGVLAAAGGGAALVAGSLAVGELRARS